MLAIGHNQVAPLDCRAAQIHSLDMHTVRFVFVKFASRSSVASLTVLPESTL
jgi:hypothetical protein